MERADRRAVVRSRIDAAKQDEIARVRFLRVLAIVLIAGEAAASEIPLPRPRPPDLVLELGLDPLTTPFPPPEPSPCQIRIAGDIAGIAPVRDHKGPGECGAVDIVKLDAVILYDRTRVPLNPAAMLRCPMAEALALWVREAVSPAAAALGAPVRAIDNFNSYECRGRNRIVGAKVSEHGRANALDIRGFRLADGKFAELTDRKLLREFRETVRRSACERFSTVLGPGSDGYHESHVHFDLIERRSGYRVCQWDVLDPLPEIPLPRPRPEDAPKSAAAERAK
jgi:hypothetical protein